MPPYPQGPRPLSDEPLPIQEEDYQLVTRTGQSVAIPAEALGGLLRPFNGRARQILLRLLAGHSLGMAAASVALSKDALDDWRKRDPEFGAAVTLCYDIGFSVGIEAEAYDRAMNREDRASGRLLELILKARSPDYREKSQLQLEVVRRVEFAGHRMIAGWQPGSSPADSGEDG